MLDARGTDREREIRRQGRFSFFRALILAKSGSLIELIFCQFPIDSPFHLLFVLFSERPYNAGNRGVQRDRSRLGRGFTMALSGSFFLVNLTIDPSRV